MPLSCFHHRRWSQTSLDVSAHILLPPGTRASDVQVRPPTHNPLLRRREK